MKQLGLKDKMPIQGVMHTVTKIERSGVTFTSDLLVDTKISLKMVKDHMFNYDDNSSKANRHSLP